SHCYAGAARPRDLSCPQTAFQLDDDVLEDLTAQIIKAQRLAVDEDGAVLDTPPHLAEKSPMQHCQQGQIAVQALCATIRPYTKFPEAKPCFIARKDSRKCIKSLPCCMANCQNILCFTISNEISQVLYVFLLMSSDFTIDSPFDSNMEA